MCSRVPSRQVPGGLHPAQSGPRRLRAGRQPDRDHGLGRVRPGARTRHSRAAGGDPRTVNAGSSRCGAAADLAGHRPDRPPARPTADRAAAARIRTNRAKVVVIDITGVPAMDPNVANHLVLTVEASRLLGATVIVTGLSPEIAQTLVEDRCRLGADDHRRRFTGRHRRGGATARLQVGRRNDADGPGPGMKRKVPIRNACKYRS